MTLEKNTYRTFYEQSYKKLILPLLKDSKSILETIHKELYHVFVLQKRSLTPQQLQMYEKTFVKIIEGCCQLIIKNEYQRGKAFFMTYFEEMINTGGRTLLNIMPCEQMMSRYGRTALEYDESVISNYLKRTPLVRITPWSKNQNILCALINGVTVRSSFNLYQNIPDFTKTDAEFSYYLWQEPRLMDYSDQKTALQRSEKY